MSLTPQGKVPADFPRRFIIDRWVLEPNSLKCFSSCHRVEELRQLIAHTEKEEKHQSEKYVRVLKEGEKALEEKTLQLARIRNEIQAQMTEYHELNSKLNKLRTELKEVQVNLRKEKIEAFNLAEKRQREKRTREQQLKVIFFLFYFLISIFVFCMGRVLFTKLNDKLSRCWVFKKINAGFFARHAKDPLRKYQFMYTACDFLKA